MKSPASREQSSRPEGSVTRRTAALRTMLTRNLPLKGFALALALVMWAFVASQKRGESTEIKFSAPLVLKNIPSELEVTSSLSQSVAVLVKVRRDLAKTVNPNQFQVGIDMRNQLAGKFEYQLSEKNIFYNNEAAPAGLTVLQISPASIPLELEKTVIKEVAVRPRFSGDLAKGFIMQEIRIDPPKVAVRGPGTLLRTLRSVPTRPLDVQDLDSNVEMLVSLELPSQVRLADAKENFFKALINVSDNPVRVLFLDIPVVFENAKNAYRASISKLNVHLEGPKAVMDRVSGDQIYAVVDLAKFPPGDYRGLTPAVPLPDRVKVLEQWPILDLFVLNRKLDRAEKANKPPPRKKSP